MKRLPGAAVLAVFAAHVGAQASLGIMDLTAKSSVSKEDASVVTDFVFAAAYQQAGVRYRIIARHARRRLLEESEFSLSDLCDSVSCALEVGKYLSADYVIVGSFTKFGSYCHLTMQIVNVGTTEVDGSLSIKGRDYDELVADLDAGVAELFGAGPSVAAPKEAAPASAPVASEPVTQRADGLAFGFKNHLHYSVAAQGC